jgi:hypothetical protein
MEVIVMAAHKFLDEDVEKVRAECHGAINTALLGRDGNVIQIMFRNKGSFVISKADVVALAKEFNLAVYEKESRP